MQLPAVVKQIGKVTGDNRVYIEDYAYTYLNELKNRDTVFPIRVALYGHAFQKETKKIYLIYGVSSVIEEMERGKNQETVLKEYFGEFSLIGYMNLYSGSKLPGEKDGCFVFYEKNEAMQNYLIACYEWKNREEAGEKPCRTEREENKKKLDSHFFSSLLQKFLFSLLVIITAISVTAINQYHRMYEFTMLVARAAQGIE